MRKPDILRELSLGQWAFLRHRYPGALRLAEQRLLADEWAFKLRLTGESGILSP
jgi:hypothetical protein